MLNFNTMDNKRIIEDPRERMKIEGFYRDKFESSKYNQITYLSLNIKRLKVDNYKAKNLLLWDFLLYMKADLIGLQEVNIN